MTAEQARIRAAVYDHLIRTGAAPYPATLATDLNLDEITVVEALRALEDARTLVLGSDRDAIWMAHPFSAVPTPYPVRTADGREYWGNCAWDALGVLALLGIDGSSASACADCDDPMTIEVKDGSLVSDDAVVHFLVPPRRFWDDVGFT